MGRILKGAKLIDGKWVVAAPVSDEVESVALELPEEVVAEPSVDLDALIAEAQAQADLLLASARAEAERLKEAARQEGYQQGFAQGDSEGRAQWQAQVQAIAAEAQALVERRRAWLQEVESDVLRLALITAERILHREAREREALASLIHGVLSQLADEAIVRIRVHPADAPSLADTLGNPEIEIKPDPAIGLGGAVFETPTGRVDARFATQFRELAASILLSDPEADPVLAPVLSDLQGALEVSIPAAERAWKPV